MITRREDRTLCLNLTTTVFFNWFTDLPREYMLIVSISGEPILSIPAPPNQFSFFTLYWKLEP